MPSSRGARRLAWLAVWVPCVVAVTVYGELSSGALLGVGTTGTLLVGVGLARRAGEAAPPVGRDGVPWLGWLGAVAAWELLTLVDDSLSTLSDLMDPVLAHPGARGLATLGWLAGGAWLLGRPSQTDRSP